jgi:cbb3-type cytochrome c oxidase subunit III
MRYIINVLIALILLLSTIGSVYAEKDDTTPTLNRGAEVFVTHCVVCHGQQGMGEGRIPLKIKGYPNTNLVSANKAKTKKEIYDVIVFGSMIDDINLYMPPMGNELTWSELESVSLFVYQLRTDPKNGISELKRALNLTKPSINLGRNIFQSRCVLCHGKYGAGDGRMTKIIKDPPPSNLTKSSMPLDYLKSIITKGGEPMGRSKQMPPWGDQLTQLEVDAVAGYVYTLRK